MGDLGKLIVAKGFKKLPKLQKIAQSGHTGHWPPSAWIISIIYLCCFPGLLMHFYLFNHDIHLVMVYLLSLNTHLHLLSLRVFEKKSPFHIFATYEASYIPGHEVRTLCVYYLWYLCYYLDIAYVIFMCIVYVIFMCIANVISMCIVYVIFMCIVMWS